MANSKDNISKYATSFIGFDEASGNVYDNIGGYVGAIYNTPTRVAGWNGKGSAMSFNGVNQYVQFNEKVIPVGEKSIRFKIKVNNTPTTSMSVFSNSGGSVHHGENISVNNIGSLEWFSSRAITGNQRFELKSTINICNGQWYDICLTWDGTTNENAVKIYIDDMVTPNVVGTAKTEEMSPATNNLFIGKFSTSNTSYFSGQLDQIEIYDRVISPIPDKHLVLHNNSYKYHNGTQWSICTDSDDDFIQYGHNDLSHITESQWLELDGDKSVVVWSDFEDKESASIVLERETFTPLDVIGNEYDIVVYDTDTKTQQLELVASTDDQELISLQDIPLLGVETINKVTVNGTGSGKVGFSVDGGVTYRAFKSGQWIPIVNMSDANSFDEVNNLTPAQMSLLRGNSNIIRMSFFITHDTVLEDVKMICSFEGSERLASSDLYDTSYDMSTKTITYTIKQAGLYSFTYTDIE